MLAHFLGLLLVAQGTPWLGELRAECPTGNGSVSVELLSLDGQMKMPNELLRGHAYSVLVDQWDRDHWQELDLPEVVVDYSGLRCEWVAAGAARGGVTNLRFYKYILSRPRFTGVYRLRVLPMGNGCFSGTDVKPSALYLDLRASDVRCAKRAELLGLPRDEEQLRMVGRPELPVAVRRCLGETSNDQRPNCFKYKREPLPLELEEAAREIKR